MKHQLIQKYEGKNKVIKRISILCLKILTSVTLLTVVFEDVQFAVVFDEFNNMSLGVVSLIFSLMFLQLLIASVRWLKILDYLNISLSHKKCAAYTWTGMFFSQALPSSIGGDAYKIFQIKPGYSYKGAFCSVFSDRCLGLLEFHAYLNVSICSTSNGTSENSWI